MQSPVDVDNASSQSRKVIQLYNRGQIDEAIPLAEEVLALREHASPRNETLLAEALTNLATLYQAKKLYDKAEDLYKRSLTLFENSVPPNPGINSVLDSLSLIRYARGDWNNAESYARRALESKEKALGKEHIDVAYTLVILIKIYEAKNDEKRAQPLYLRVVSILENTNVTVPEMLARVLASYACSVKSNKEETQKRIDELFVKIQPGVPRGVPVSGGVLNGKAVCLVKPDYPLMARRVRAQGTVVVQVVIDEAGKVTSAKAVSGAPELGRVSEEAAQKSRFTPTYLAGYPVRVTGVITYHFIPQ